MGISNLLPFVEKASKACHLSELKNKTLAVDAYCWLHKGSYGCAEKLVLGEDTNSHILYCMKYVKMLLSYHIKPILVFDGKHLPAKLDTEKKRRDNRKAAKIRAAEFLRLGKREEARANFNKAVDITHAMALQLIKECRKINVDCIVAPYEADSQLAFLNIQNIADVVVTEDSDLLTFGCKKVLFKLDLSGSGILVDADMLYVTMNIRQEKYSLEKFQLMCILSGCDYLESLPGIGLKKSLKFITTTENPDFYNTLSKIPIYLNMKQLKVTDDYRKNVMVALATFQHQVVFDPINRKSVHLTSKEQVGTKEEYCYNTGEIMSDEIAFQLAVGNVDPFTLKTVDNWKPEENHQYFSKSIWSINYKKNDFKVEFKRNSPVKQNFQYTKGQSVTINTDKLIRHNEKVAEDEKKEYDEKILAEINKFYRSPEGPATKKAKIEFEKEIQSKANSSTDDELSPVIANKMYNPFIKSKAKSASATEDIDISKIVHSRFFAETADKETDANSESILSTGLLHSIDTSCVNKRNALKTCNVESDLENCSPPEGNTLDLETFVETAEKASTEVPVNKLSAFETNKKCRQPGLTRKNSGKAKVPDKKQPSVLAMFQLMKK